MLTFTHSYVLPWPAAPISAVIFDLDGTITRPVLDFDRIRREIGVDGLILEAVAKLDEAARKRAFGILERHEMIAAESSELNPGISELLRLIDDAGCSKALVTRNSRKSVNVVSSRHELRFDAIVTRDDAPAKPSPEPLHLACRLLGTPPAEVLWIGDSPLDREAGIAAGIRTAIIRPRCSGPDDEALVIESARELVGMLCIAAIDDTDQVEAVREPPLPRSEDGT